MIASQIDYILSTYKLPKLTRDRILAIAFREIERLGLTFFDDQYKYIDGLVEIFYRSYIERHFLRLDHGGKDGDNPLSKILVVPVDYEDGDIFSETVRDNTSMIYIRPRGVLYARPGGGTRRRLFDGDPLAYFKANEKMFRGMNRGQLAFHEPQLHAALYRTGQLEKAIPYKIDTSIPADRKQRIIDSYQTCNGNAALAARTLNENGYCVRTVWLKHNLKPCGAPFIRPRSTMADITKVKEELIKCGGNRAQVARNLGMSYAKVRYIHNKYIGPIETEPKTSEEKSAEEIQKPNDHIMCVLDRTGLVCTSKPVKQTKDTQVAAPNANHRINQQD